MVLLDSPHAISAWLVGKRRLEQLGVTPVAASVYLARNQQSGTGARRVSEKISSSRRAFSLHQ
jgi:hypothetical protein